MHDPIPQAIAGVALTKQRSPATRGDRRPTPRSRRVPHPLPGVASGEAMVADLVPERALHHSSSQRSFGYLAIGSPGMPPPPGSNEQVLVLLADTPSCLAELAARCSPEQLAATPEPGEWSVTEVLAHFCACADVWGSSIARILNEDTPAFRYVSPRTWIRKTDYLDWAFDAALAAFTEQRAGQIARLESLPLEAWHRTANVTKSRKPRIETVLSYADDMANHEIVHLDQVAHIVESVCHN
jgi:uncharacterized damage-inducible protein DinB